MFTDPTGFSSDGTNAGLQNSMTVQQILSNPSRLILNVIKKAGNVANYYDMIRSGITILLSEEGTLADLGLMLIRGYVTNKVTNAFCSILAMNRIAGIAITAFGFASQIASLADAIKNGQWDLVVARTISLGGMTAGLFQPTCFTGDTLIATEDGYKRIDEIEEGDLVWAYNVETDELALQEVVHLFVKENNEILHLTTSTGDTIRTTENHPFYVIGMGWIAAGDLNVGDKLLLLDGETATIQTAELEILDEPIPVYNFEVAVFHTYFVGSAGVLVHNVYPSTGGGNNTPRTGSVSSRSVLREAKLPTRGTIRYVPPKNWTPSQPLPRQDHGFVDRFGNVWTKGPSRTRGQLFEWDVQLSRTGRIQLGWATRDGSHLNVSLDGKITHR